MEMLNTCFATTESYRMLALYSHLIPGLAIFVLGLFSFLWGSNKFKGLLFFGFCITFVTWLILDFVPWTVDDYFWVAATWAPLDYINIVFFLLLFYFVYIDLSPKPMSLFLRGLILIAAAIPFVITVSGNSVFEFNEPVCEMLGNDFLAQYKLGLELTILVATLLLGIIRIVATWRNKVERIRVALIAGSIFLFMGVFAFAEYESVQTEVYEIMLYSLFSLPIFILILTIAITSYGTFRLGDAAVKLLFYIFLVLATTQFFYVGDRTEFLLAGMSFIVILTLGIMLFRSNEREIVARHQLETANQQQESLLHFISHEVKGFLTEGQNAFAGIIEGDFGQAPPKMQGMAQLALSKMRNGVATVMDILDAANLKKGTVSYKKDEFDMTKAVGEVCNDLALAANAKELQVTCSVPEQPLTFTGDQDKLKRHVIRNILDNSIKYTPKGSIDVTLEETKNRIRFVVKDTGVGITKEDMQHLFTEGGKGKDSTRVNVNSTGYGLFVAKSVTEAHGGKIWAESEGPGKGSRFVVELPRKEQ